MGLISVNPEIARLYSSNHDKQVVWRIFYIKAVLREQHSIKGLDVQGLNSGKMDKTGLYYQNHPDPDFPGPTSSGIRHWRQKVIRAGEKIFYRFYPARADYTQPRSIRNRISRESQKVWNDHTRKEFCRFLFLNNFHDGDREFFLLWGFEIPRR